MQKQKLLTISSLNHQCSTYCGAHTGWEAEIEFFWEEKLPQNTIVEAGRNKLVIFYKSFREVVVSFADGIFILEDGETIGFKSVQSSELSFRVRFGTQQCLGPGGARSHACVRMRSRASMRESARMRSRARMCECARMRSLVRSHAVACARSFASMREHARVRSLATSKGRARFVTCARFCALSLHTYLLP